VMAAMKNAFQAASDPYFVLISTSQQVAAPGRRAGGCQLALVHQ
jgi:hypothetical protein